MLNILIWIDFDRFEGASFDTVMCIHVTRIMLYIITLNELENQLKNIVYEK